MGLSSPFRYLLSSLRAPAPDEMFWALSDVSFEIRRGEVVGLIGKNGAGKSTLLKIISRIIEPSDGHVMVYGRVGSLLEVGTGFHPELTGRENIYLNGALLGMRRKEIEGKFDEIVAFAEVDKFLDTPVKRYSSGMYVRLAFSVAAHLEPEILLVDEVLAVGDLAFQQKCLERIQKLTQTGMTILLVSHNMAAIQSACKRAIFLDRGHVVANGDVMQTIEAYRSALQKSGGDRAESMPGSNASPAAGGVSVTGFEMFGEDGQPCREVAFGAPIRIRIHLNARQRIEKPMINLGLRRGDGVVVSNFNNWYDNFEIPYIEGDCVLEGWLPPLRLVPDFYEVHVLVWPWAGGHQGGGIEGSRPLAWERFGDMRVVGPGLNSHDGVFQVPARKWLFRNGAKAIESSTIDDKTIFEVFKPEKD
jgi:lipopolysaccharide transport system ATP-binding protein